MPTPATGKFHAASAFVDLGSDFATSFVLQPAIENVNVKAYAFGHIS